MLRHEHGDAGNEAEAQILSHLALAQKLLRARDPVAILIANRWAVNGRSLRTVRRNMLSEERSRRTRRRPRAQFRAKGQHFRRIF